MDPINVNNREPLKVELQDFIDAVKKGRHPLVSGEEGLKALRIATDVMKAMKG